MKALALLIGLFSSGVLAAVPNWHLIFCLPYDNDLAQHADFIQLELGRLHISDEVAMTLLVDTPDEPIRFVHYPPNRAPRTDSTQYTTFADGEALSAFLDWSVQKVPKAKRTAFFMLGHGGGINRMALEMHPDSTWMTTVRFAQVVQKHVDQHGRFDAMLLQQCSKSTLTELVELASLTEYIAASPLPIGAPNYYYAHVVDGIQHGEYRKPVQLLEACLTHDKPGMSHVWAVVKTDQLLRFVDVLEGQLRQTPHSSPNLKSTDRVIYGGTDYWDMRVWVHLLSEQTLPSQQASLRSLYKVLPGTWVRKGTTAPMSELSGIMVSSHHGLGNEFALQRMAPLLWELLP